MLVAACQEATKGGLIMHSSCRALVASVPKEIYIVFVESRGVADNNFLNCSNRLNSDLNNEIIKSMEFGLEQLKWTPAREAPPRDNNNLSC